jgi:hypothetical protein
VVLLALLAGLAVTAIVAVRWSAPASRDAPRGPGRQPSPPPRPRTGAPTADVASAPLDAPIARPSAETAHESIEECAARCDTACNTGPSGTASCPIPCTSNAQCTEDELCLSAELHDGRRARRCKASECTAVGASAECGERRQCEYFGNPDGGVYRCVATGDQGLGQSCADLGASERERCRRGLRCVSGVCLPLTCEDHDDCSLPGARCATNDSVETVKTCIPWCFDDADCGPRHRCAKHAGSPRCVPAATADCTVTGCEPGARCYRFSASYESVTAACFRTCDGSVASPPAPDPCGPGARCVQMFVVEPAACLTSCRVDQDCAAPLHCVEAGLGAQQGRYCARLPDGVDSLTELLDRYRVVD